MEKQVMSVLWALLALLGYISAIDNDVPIGPWVYVAIICSTVWAAA